MECTVFCYGENDKSVLGLPEAGTYLVTPLMSQPETGASLLFGSDEDEQEIPTSFFPPFSVLFISTSPYHTLFLTTYGVCYGVGSNNANRLGLCKEAKDVNFVVTEPTRIRFFTDLNLRVTMCHASESGSIWCTEDGCLWYAGRIMYNDNNVDAMGPLVIAKNVPKIKDIVANIYGTIILLADDGRLYYRDITKSEDHNSSLLLMSMAGLNQNFFVKQIVPRCLLDCKVHLYRLTR
jgi:alpha-tubulin suppressor-like RCC1 family protein